MPKSRRENGGEKRKVDFYIRIQLYLYICTFIYIFIYIWVGVEPGTQRHSKWSENQICSLSPPPTSIATHLPPVCRLHSSHPLPHLPPYRSPLWPRYRSTLAATLPPRASKARTSTALWSCRQPPSSTLRRRPNSIPHGPQALELKPPFFPSSPSVYISIFILKEGTFHFLFEWIFSRTSLPRLPPIGKFWGKNFFFAMEMHQM